MRTSLATRLLLTATLLLSASTAVHAQDSCDASSFKGAFGYSLKGTYYDQNYYVYLIGAAGRLVSDGAGTFTGTDTISYDGSVSKRKVTGTYTVNADCTGSLILSSDANSFVTHADFVIMNDGKEVTLVETDPGIILTGDLKLQKSVVVAAVPAQ